MNRVLRRAGGSCWSSPRWRRRWPKTYDWYSFSVLPRIGRLVASDADSYRYLAGRSACAGQAELRR